MTFTSKGGRGPTVTDDPPFGETTAGPVNYNPTKPDTIPLNKVYVHVGNEKIYFGRSDRDVKRGGLVRTPVASYGPQRDPTERLAWATDRAHTNFKQWLFNEPSHVVLDENGEYDDTDGGGRALIAHMLGHPTIEAFVQRNIPLVARAAMFQEHANGRVAIGAVQDFLAEVAKLNPRCIAIKNALHPNYVVRKGGKDAINSVGALYDIYDEAGPAVMKRTAQLAGNAWRPKYKKLKGGKMKTEKLGYHVPGIVFVALALNVEALPEKYNEAKLRDYLQHHSPDVIKQQAVDEIAKLAAKVGKGSPAVAFKLLSQHLAVPMARVIARGYNFKLDETKFAPIDLNGFDTSKLAELFSELRSSRKGK